MAAFAAYDRFDIAVCGVVAMLLAAAYGMTKQDTSAVCDERSRITLAEKITLWATAGMLSAVLLAGVVWR